MIRLLSLVAVFAMGAAARAQYDSQPWGFYAMPVLVIVYANAKMLLSREGPIR